MPDNNRKLDRKSKTLLKNTVMLYLLQFSNYFFSFATVPYQTRVLKDEVYGKLVFAVGVMIYFQLFVDFGFLLSATEDISKNRDDHGYICKKITSVAIVKILFALVSFLIMGILCLSVSRFSGDPALYLIYLAAYVAGSFLPDYVYRGLEKMTAVTVRTLLIRLFFCVMIFVFLRKPGDYLVVPILLLIGNVGAVFGAYLHLFKGLKYRFGKVTKRDIIGEIKRSSLFFYSRIATTVYSATNTLLLGFVIKTNTDAILGHYGSADKVLTTSKNCISPISDSLYPYMVKNRDFKPAKKWLLLFMPVILTGCIVVGIFAEPICVLVFGEDFRGSANILRAFLPAIAVTLPSYIFAFPAMGAMGISRYANYSVFFGTAIHIVGIVILLATGHFSAFSVACMTSVTECCIFLYRIIVVYKNRHLMKEGAEK